MEMISGVAVSWTTGCDDSRTSASVGVRENIREWKQRPLVVCNDTRLGINSTPSKYRATISDNDIDT